MNIGVLAFQSRQYQKYTEAEALADRAREMGHDVTFLRWDEITWSFASESVELLWKGKPLPKLDAILARPRVWGDPSVVKTMLQAFEDAGHLLINGSSGIWNAKSKARSQLLFQRHGLPSPSTRFVYDESQLEVATKDFSWPIILKSIYGSYGVGVFVADDLRTARPIVNFLTMRGYDDPAIIQEYVPEASEDIRAFVVGGQVVAAMSRKATNGDFRSNLHRGAEGTVVELTEEEKALAVRAAEVFKLDIAGVDLVRSARGPMVIEVNSNPGLTGITEVTGVDVAGKIVEYVVEQAQNRSSETGKA